MGRFMGVCSFDVPALSDGEGPAREARGAKGTTVNVLRGAAGSASPTNRTCSSSKPSVLANARPEAEGLRLATTYNAYQEHTLSTLIAELRYAMRQFLAARVFTITAVLTLALGIGGTTAIFTLIHAVMLRVAAGQ